jgi:hypothetical protein
MREYTPSELDWEYEREYLVYSCSRFPGLFVSREDFQRKLDAAPIIAYNRDLRLANFSGPYNTLDEVVAAHSHRRDVARIAGGIRSGTLPPPILICYAPQRYYVMSGNTRLSVASAVELPLECKVIHF